MVGDLPGNTIVWALQQDRARPDLFFIGTEFGLYWSPNHGGNWYELSGGVPTIPFRDVKLQRRDHDLVGASFGRGFYVLDDYTPLRAIAAGDLTKEAVLFPVRDAWWYVPSQLAQAPGRPTAGSDDFTAPNPPMGALLTYFLKEPPTTAKERRHAAERDLRAQGADVAVPGYDLLRAEAIEGGPKVLVLVSDAAGQPVRWIEGPITAGLHRVSWDLRGPDPDAIDLSPPGFQPPWDAPSKGPLAAPGRYTATLVVVSASGARRVGPPQSFEVKPVPTLEPGTDVAAVAAFQQRTAELSRRVSAAGAEMDRLDEQLRYARAALVQTPRADPSLYGRIDSAGAALTGLRARLQGDPERQRLSEPTSPSISERVGLVRSGHWETRQMPTVTQQRDLEIATTEMARLTQDLTAFVAGPLTRLRQDLTAAGAPWTPGRGTPP